MEDIIIRNGLIVDGTGAPAYTGDIAIRDGVISAISNGTSLALHAHREIDATDRIVSPGWVDIHTHLDAQLTWDPLLAPFTANGVTTAVTGNCGVTFAPCRKEQRTFLMELMEGVEDIPLGAMQAGIKWHWESFPEFLDYLDTLQLGCDVAAMVGHGAVRAYCLGERANVTDLPGAYRDPASKISSEEMEEMARVVHDAIVAGAIGFSTSRTLLHRDRNGTLVPGTLAAEEELLRIGKAVAEAGGGVFEMASDFMSYDDAPHTEEDKLVRLERFGREWIWVEQISNGFGIPVNICLGIPSVTTDAMDANGYREMFKRVKAANSMGSDIKLQVFTRPQGIQMCWDARSHPFIESPTFLTLLVDAMKNKEPIDKARLLDPEVKRKIVEETLADISAAADDAGTFGVVLPTSTDEEEDLYLGNINGSVSGKGALAKFYFSGAEYIFRWTEQYEPTDSDCLAAEARKLGKHPMDVLYDWLCEEDGMQVVSFLFMNYHHKSLDMTCEMLYQEDSIPGLGDAGAHAGFIVDSTSHSYLLTYHVRDRQRGPRIPLEYAVKLHTHDTASAFGLHDRGQLIVGKKADVNVIDLKSLRCHRPRFVLDGIAPRWIQEADGYDYTILSGQIVHDHGQHTGALPGRLVRNPKAGKGVPQGYKPGSLTGNMKVWLTQARLETKQLAFKTLLRVLGPSTLESIGSYLNTTPLPAPRL